MAANWLCPAPWVVYRRTATRDTPGASCLSNSSTTLGRPAPGPLTEVHRPWRGGWPFADHCAGGRRAQGPHRELGSRNRPARSRGGRSPADFERERARCVHLTAEVRDQMGARKPAARLAGAPTGLTTRTGETPRAFGRGFGNGVRGEDRTRSYPRTLNRRSEQSMPNATVKIAGRRAATAPWGKRIRGGMSCMLSCPQVDEIAGK
jgi:hypothetical protein